MPTSSNRIKQGIRDNLIKFDYPFKPTSGVYIDLVQDTEEENQHYYEKATCITKIMRRYGQKSRKYDMSITEMYQLIKHQLEQQHEETITVVKRESSNSKQEIIECVRNNPVATVELFSKLSLIFALLSLGVYGVIGFQIVNPLFALLIFLSSLSGILMAKIRLRAIDRKNGDDTFHH